MTTYCVKDYLSYPVKYGYDEKANVYTAYFRDIDGFTQSETRGDLKETALDFLVLSGIVFPRNHKIIPPASAPKAGEDTIGLSPAIAMKFILRNVMTSKNIRPSDLGR